MAQDHDFVINDTLGFNVATNKERPYERATAQFRKEQFDSTPTVGDQSLTGWWTRGQLSFHKGAGVTYYEVTDGETVIDRFDSGVNVNPFTPGQVTMSKSLSEIDTSTVGAGFGFVDCVYLVDYLNGDRIVGRGDNGKAYHVTVGSPFSSQTVTQITTTGTAPVASVASSRFRVYLAVGQKIEVWYPGMASSTVLWTGTLGGYDIVNIWYAKQRLWIVDGNGNWYVLDTAGGSFTTTDYKFRIKDYGWLVATDQTWSLVESPGPVFISAFNEVYAVTVTYDSGSLLPTIEAPVLVAEIPGNEIIHCLGYGLGVLMMATGAGARFAVMDGAGLAYGPALAKFFNFVGARRIAGVGTRLCTGAYFFEETGVYSFDLAQQVSQLEPSHVLEYQAGDSIGYTGALSTPGGLVTWNATEKKLYRQSSTVYAAEAGLKTAYHRYGTLDPKWFRSVLVRATGDGGTIDVYRVDPDDGAGVETLLGSIDVTGGETQADLDLGPDDPVERVALKFTLKRDASDTTKAPVLLGYQLRALPLPKRQRMIRASFQLLDSETNRYGQKMLTEPKARLQALEDLESSNALVTFEDKIYGETGIAYVEAVEYVQAASRDFGGIVTVTFRKVGP